MSGARAVLGVEAALQGMLDAVAPMDDREVVLLADGLGRVLADAVSSPCDVPPADNSAMDGYALRVADLIAEGGQLPVVLRVAAGHPRGVLPEGAAARIFTGAPVPLGADAVVMQERCSEEAGFVQVSDAPAPGANIRRAGEDILAGSAILAPGHCLRPQELGLVASVGIAELAVFRRVRVAIVATGDELVPPGQPLADGKIFESNGTVLRGMLATLGCEVVGPVYAADTLADTREALRAAAAQADLVIASGGVSVGDADHVKAAVEAEGELALWKIAVKPGKPLAFGRVGAVPFLGLPGNPVSLLVTFLLFGAPLLRKLQGRNHWRSAPLRLPARFVHEYAGGREEYLRVRIQDGALERFPHQGSGVLSSAVWADGLARIPPDSTVSEGDVVDYYPFHALLD